jgi:hypothetical protein
MKHFTVAVFLFVSLNLYADKPEKALTGSWHLTHWMFNGADLKGNELNPYISFYNNKIFQEQDSVICNGLPDCPDTALLASGYWEYAKKTKQVYVYGHQTSFTGFVLRDSAALILVNDTELILRLDYNDESFATLYFERVSLLKQLEIPKPKLVVFVDTTAPPASLKPVYLVNSVDTSKKILLDPDGITTITTLQPDSIFTDALRKTTYEGTVSSSHDSTVTITYPLELTWLFTNLDGDAIASRSSTTSHLMPSITIPVSKINLFTYNSSNRTSWQIFGQGLCGYSCFEILVISPLVSIKYKKGGFNSKRYFTWAGIGLAAFAVSIPIMTFNRPKSYNVVSKGSKTGKSYWYFQQH